MLVETLFCVDAILSKVIKSSKISRLQGLDVKKNGSSNIKTLS